MKTLKKRLTVKNDGFAKTKRPASDRVLDCTTRYVNKMAEKGWFPFDNLTGGNAFLVYEMHIRMCKPNPSNKDEIAKAESWANESGWKKENGKWSRC